VNLVIKVEDFNSIVKKPNLLRKLRNLTIRPSSGMNFELNSLEKDAESRTIKCKILMAFSNRKLVGWAMLSKEPSSFPFFNTEYAPNFGTLFEVYVDPNHRRQGIASALIEKSLNISGTDRLCVCPHDPQSTGFFNKYKNINPKIL
jgi:ribosomal protein S18 acetylase RimI-like enzyme